MADLEGLGAYVGSDGFARLFGGLYGGAHDAHMHRQRFSALLKRHEIALGSQASHGSGLFSTAGRSELGGNHTDHNLGKVIAATISLDTIAVATPTGCTVVRLLSEGFPEVTVSLEDLSARKEEAGTTDALVRGIAAGFVERGLHIGGFIATTSTRVLKGSGLSSSAAIEVLIGTLFNNLFNRDALSPVELAVIGKEAENRYFGKPSGLMDQVACAHGGIVHIDFKEPSAPRITPITSDFQQMGYDLIVVDTGGDHADLTPDYAAIPKEMRAVAACFDEEILRNVPFGRFMESVGALRKRLHNDRAILRAYHYLAENERVDAMLGALQRHEVAHYLELVRQSGDSSYRFLQNLYSPQQTTQQGLSLALAMTERFLEGTGACRVHGGGFAGTIQVYVPIERTASYVAFIESVFGTGAANVLAIRSLPSCRLD